MMKLNVIKTLVLLLSLYTIVQAQPRPGEKKLDGVVAVVGDEIVLSSDIKRDYILQKQKYGDEIDMCSFVGNTLLQKMVLYHAERDTLIEISNTRISDRADQIVEDFRSRGSDEEVMNVYGVRTIPELKKEVEILVRQNAMSEQKQGLITEGVDASPQEVKEFYDQYKDDLPEVNEEVELAHIIMFPEITPEHEQEIIDQLKGIKKEIEEGASFETKAILYSEDPGSSSNGGLYKNIKRGTFVPEFDAVAFNLEEGEISDPVNTEFGYHIIKLEKRLGQAIDVRHILIQAKPTEEELKTATVLLDSIRSKITAGDLTFKEAAKKYSVDKYTRFNGGVITNPSTGEDRFERSKLPLKQVYALAGLNEEDISSPFESEHDRKTSVEILQLNKIIPAHKIDMETDFTRLKNYALQEKKQEAVYNWVKKELPDTFISISEEYQDCDFELNWLKK